MDSLKTRYKLDFFGITDQGLVRTTNQDVWECVADLQLFLLADGMGGHKAGEVAAAESIRSVIDYVKEHPLQNESPLAFYQKAIGYSNKWVYEKSRQEKKYEGMGTTLCLLAFHQEQVVVAHVGDSRIYRLREQKLERLTEDHSLAAELIAMGTMAEEDVQLHSFKNVLTRALGTHSSIEATISVLPSKEHDLYMLCSDGLTNTVTDIQINKILNAPFSLEERGRALVELAKEQGGSDNITLVLVQVNHDLFR